MLRAEIDRLRLRGRFLLLGSANPALLQQSAETLAGRIVYKELSGFNFLEIPSHYSLEHHWLYGGFPESFFMQNQALRSEWFRSFIMTYIERDLSFYGLNNHTQHTLRLLTMLAHATGGILNKSSLAKSLGKNVHTISKYVNYLVNSFILRLLPPFHVNVKKRLVKSPKAYLRDSGLRHHLLRIDDYNQLLGHPVVGHSWEGYVIEQIISVLGDRYDYFFYRTQDGAECDLVITRQFQPIACVEIKFTSSPQKSKSLTIATRDVETKQNFIIIPDCSEPYPLDEHLEVCDLAQFLHRATAWE